MTVILVPRFTLANVESFNQLHEIRNKKYSISVIKSYIYRKRVSDSSDTENEEDIIDKAIDESIKAVAAKNDITPDIVKKILKVKDTIFLDSFA
jgi:hypothetical protein